MARTRLLLADLLLPRLVAVAHGGALEPLIASCSIASGAASRLQLGPPYPSLSSSSGAPRQYCVGRGPFASADALCLSRHTSSKLFLSWWQPWSCRCFGTVVPFPLAQTGEGISECEVVEWFVKVGDVVQQFDKVCEVQSDKASIEITSRYSGRIRAIHHAKGAVCKVGAALLDIEVEEGALEGHVEATSGAAATTAAAAAAASAAHAHIAAAPAGAAAGPDPTYPVQQPSIAGAAAAAAPQGGAPSLPPSPSLQRQPAALAAAQAPATSTQHAPRDRREVRASPAVRHLARELGVELADVQGTAEGGRITKEDLTRHVEAVSAQPAASSASPHVTVPEATAAQQDGAEGSAVLAAAAQHLADTVGEATPPQDKRIPIRGYRRAMVKSMTAAAAIPHFHFCDELHLDSLAALRTTLKGDPALQGAKLTLLPFIVKALSAALLQHPGVNASLSADGKELLLHGRHNIGVAMATPHGLVVPNIKDVHSKSVARVAADLAALQVMAAEGRLPPEALAGGTITISNIGTIGGTYATPLVNPPEVAIVALGRVQHLPRFAPSSSSAQPGPATSGSHRHGGPQHHQHSGLEVVSRAVMAVSWGADHRVVDGAALAALSNTWKGFLEEPGRLLLQLR